jgi:hypothetical protein
LKLVFRRELFATALFVCNCPISLEQRLRELTMGDRFKVWIFHHSGKFSAIMA